MKTLRSEVVNLIKENIKKVGGGRILANGLPLYKVVFDYDGGYVEMLHQEFNTPKGCIGVENWQFGNGFEIDGNTSDYRLRKVADRIVAEYHRIKQLEDELESYT